MIRKLKIKFILLSMTSLFVLLTILVAGMNFINYTAVIRDADEILSLLSQNHGAFPAEPGNPSFLPGNRLPLHMSPELPYESRYFSVLLQEDGGVLYADTSKIASVDPETAVEYALTVLYQEKNRGFTDGYRFLRTAEDDIVRITFLNCNSRLDSFRTFLCASILIAAIGFAAVFFVICFFAGRIIRPIAESYEKQKRFITDAGHEIKTPLTIINANVDLLEMEIEENESLADIRQQTSRLAALTNDLVYLARMEEAEHTLPMIESPISEIVRETAEPFRVPAQADGKTLRLEISPLLSVRGNDKAIRQLVSVLLDNALKYSPTGGEIALTLTGQGRQVVLTVRNTVASPIDPKTLDRVFDRFYRTDPSRNSSLGGHGIGLSVAKAIVSAHSGRIAASASEDGMTFCITVWFPV